MNLDHPTIQYLDSCIVNYELSEVEAYYESFVPRTDFDFRVRANHLGQVAAVKGQFPEAERFYLTALEHGENLRVLRDLTDLYYVTGRFSDGKRMLSLLKEKLALHRDKLSLPTICNAEILVAKTLEEDGFIFSALEIYERLYREIKKTMSHELFYFCLPQMLRLKAHFGLNHDLGIIYTELLTLKSTLIPASSKIEVQHSLMLAELALVGPEHAWARVELAFQVAKTPMSDRRLIFYDFVEEQLLKNMKLPASAEALAHQLIGHDLYEQELHKLAFTGIGSADLVHLHHLASEMSWACHMRLMSLYALYFAQTPTEPEIRNKMNLMLLSIEPSSRVFWLNRSRPLAQREITRIHFDRNARKLNFGDRSIDLAKKRSVVALVETLLINSQLPIESVLQEVWKAEYSPESYHRLRMTVHRLNQVIFQLTAIPKAIEVSADSVGLRSAFEIQLLLRDGPVSQLI